MILEQGKYEQPDSGIFIGVVADVVELYGVKTKFGEKNKIRIVWILDKNDKQGKPYRVVFQKNASMHEKSDLYKAVRAILGENPPVKFDTETLIGRANQLFIMKESDPSGKEFANVKGINALPAGTAIPKIPADFVRAKDKQAFVPGQPLNTPAASGPVATPASAPAPVSQPASYQASGQYTPPAPPAAQSTNASF